MKINSIFP